MSISELCYKHYYLATLPRGGPQERTCTKRERHSPPQHVSCDGHDGGFDIMAHNRRRNVVISASPSTGCRSCSVVTVGNHAANHAIFQPSLAAEPAGFLGQWWIGRTSHKAELIWLAGSVLVPAAVLKSADAMRQGEPPEIDPQIRPKPHATWASVKPSTAGFRADRQR